MGRPPLPPRDRRDALLRLHLCEEDATRVRRAARAHGQTVSGWLRDTILDVLAGAAVRA